MIMTVGGNEATVKCMADYAAFSMEDELLMYVLLKVLSPFQLDKDQITDSGKFRYLDEVLPLMKSRVSLCYWHFLPDR